VTKTFFWITIKTEYTAVAVLRRYELSLYNTVIQHNTLEEVFLLNPVNDKDPTQLPTFSKIGYVKQNKHLQYQYNPPLYI
jgi:hypothetical protein